MHTASIFRAKSLRVWSALIVIYAVLLSAPINLHAQERQGDGAERRRAIELLQKGNAIEALPLLEKLSEQHPNDGEVTFYLGFALYSKVKTLKEADARKAMRFRARAALLRAKELGVNTPLLDSLLESLPADGGGGDEVYSANKEADGAMRDGEAAFVQGKLDEALAHYRRALELDPKLYTAALFAGDMYFKKSEFDKAGEWYARAIEIDPERETAYRYSASPLMQQGKYAQAKAKYIEAVIAEPYNRLSWAGLARWAQATDTPLTHPRIDIPASVTPLKDNKMTITVPDASDKDDGTAAWTAYGIGRAAWATSKFTKEFPNEKTYRHTLREEAEALGLVVSSVKTQTKEGKIKTLDPTLARLVKLHDEGLLEAYILFARPDEGVVQDYAEYRKANREKLRRYLIEYVTSGRQ